MLISGAKDSSEELEESDGWIIATYGHMKAPNVEDRTLEEPSPFSLVFHIPALWAKSLSLLEVSFKQKW